jgi:5-methylthioribose kinase
MGFDLGALLGNLFFSYFSQEPAGGFDQRNESKESDYAVWVSEQILVWYSAFEAEVLQLWESLSKGKGEFFTGGISSSSIVLVAAQQKFLAELWADTLGFAGVKMIRRIVGVSHVADLEEIDDELNRFIYIYI